VDLLLYEIKAILFYMSTLRYVSVLKIDKPPSIDRCHIDFLKMPPVNGYTRFLVAVDAYSKLVEAFPVYTEKAKETAEVLCWQLFSRHGAPTALVSDLSKKHFRAS
jgi:hypothetical protein